MEKEITKRAQQAIDTRKKIFNTSIDLIREHGFDGVTIENISKNAGVSVGAFYHYFESKSRVIYEIMNTIDEHYEKVVRNQLCGTAFDKITAFFGFYADYVQLRDKDFIKHLYSTENRFFVKKDRYIWVLLSELIEEGQRNGELTRGNSADEISSTLFSLARGMVFDWCLNDGSYDLKTALTGLITRILSTYKA